MTTEHDRQRKALAVRPGRPDYEVGYAKPPAETRFKPGQSGNPHGRPKGSKNRPKPPALNGERLKTIILEEAYRTVTINDANGPVSIPIAQAVIRSLAVNAAKGNQRAQRLFTELLASIETANKRLHDEWLDMAITYKVEWERELQRRARLGITGPEPLPHPDHVILDLRKGTAYVKGPMTKEESSSWISGSGRGCCSRKSLRSSDVSGRTRTIPIKPLWRTRSPRRRRCWSSSPWRWRQARSRRSFRGCTQRLLLSAPRCRKMIAADRRD